jgi:hypothetical protein
MHSSVRLANLGLILHLLIEHQKRPLKIETESLILLKKWLSFVCFLTSLSSPFVHDSVAALSASNGIPLANLILMMTFCNLPSVAKIDKKAALKWD